MRHEFGKASIPRRGGEVALTAHDLPLQKAASPDSAAADSVKAVHTRPQTEMTVEKIETLEQLGAIRDEWDDLLQHSNSDTIFLTWEWTYTWWKHLSARRRLCVIVVWKKSRLIAIAPLALEKAKPGRLRPFRCMEFIGMGTVSTDYTNLILRTGEENSALEMLTNYIHQNRIMLELKGIEKGSKATSELAARLSKNDWGIRTAVTDICPFAALQGHSWESYVSSLGRSHRQNLRRRIRHIEKNFSPTFEESKTETQRQKFIETFATLHHKRWDTRQGSSALNSESVMRFHENFSRLALQRGWLRLFLLRLDGQPAAAIYGFEYRNVFYYYQAGFDPEFANLSIGLVALAYSIRDSIRKGLHEYDFLRGNEHYKFLWSTSNRELMTIQGYPPSLLGAITRGIDGIRHGIKALRDQVGTGTGSYVGRNIP